MLGDRSMNALYLKIKELLAWHGRQFEKTQISFGDMMEKLPEYKRAFKYVIAEIDKACLADSLKAMDDNCENFKRLYSKALGKMG
jgi:hypothetical protein